MKYSTDPTTPEREPDGDGHDATPKDVRPPMRLARAVTALLFLGGLLLLVGMIGRVDLADLGRVFYATGLGLLPYLGLRIVPDLLHTLAWRACFTARRLPLSWGRLFLIRQAGSAINKMTPTAEIGGEVTKVLLLEPALPRQHAMAAVVVDKASMTLGKMIYLALGMLYLTHRLPLPRELYVGLVVSIGLISLGLIGFVAGQRYGLLARLVRGVGETRLGRRRMQRLRQQLLLLDHQLMTYHTRHAGRFVGSLLLHTMAYGFQPVKIFILLRLLLGPQAPGFAEAARVAVAVSALDQMFFFVPGRLGTLEGARLVVLTALGITPVYGLAFGLVARLEQLLWSGFGMLAYAHCIRRPVLAMPASTAGTSSSAS